MTDPFERAVLREQLDRQEAAAQRHRSGLTIHATVYVAVNILLVVIWALTWTGYPWFVFPILGWGIGLAAHAAAYRSRASRQHTLQPDRRSP